MSTEETPRSSALRRSREDKMAQWFGQRRWRVAIELTFENSDIVVHEGEFWVKGGKVFRTPFGNKGTHGYIMQEVNPETGRDVWDDKEHGPSRVSLGWVIIRNAAQMFPGSITDVPPRPYGQRGGVAAALEKKTRKELRAMYPDYLYWEGDPGADVSGMRHPVRCTKCGRVYDLGSITEYGRYADCTVWRCPGCHCTVDDRPVGWGDHHYVELDGNGMERRAVHRAGRVGERRGDDVRPSGREH